MRVLVTRPQPGADETSTALRAIGIEPIVAPLLTVRWLAPALPEADSIDAIALTSANGLRGLVALEGAGALMGKPVFAVGQQTARAARAAGFSSVTSADGDMNTLVDVISTRFVHGSLLYPGAQHVAGDLGAALSGDGIGVIDVVVYDMVAVERLPATVMDALEGGQVDAVLLYSRRTAETFVALTTDLGDDPKGRLQVGCISEQVAEAARNAGFGTIRIAAAPNEAAMLALASSFAGRQNPA